MTTLELSPSSINTAEMSPFARTIMLHKYSEKGQEEWIDIARRVVTNVVGPYLPEFVGPLIDAIAERKFMPGGRYLYSSGKPIHQVNNCLLLTVDDSREGWASLMRRVTQGLMTGAGIGVVYSALRERNAPVHGMGGKSSGPCALMMMVNETGRYIRQGGDRRAALWAGLHWNHPDVFEFISMKDWSDEVKALKEADYNFPASMDGTNISVILDDEFFSAYHSETHKMHDWALHVYWSVVEKMLTTGEPGFSIDTGNNSGEHLRNACTELTSADDNDICNLGSINIARVDTKQEFCNLVELGTVFLLCGTLYSMLPFEEVENVRTKNRRLGLGIMGFHEWLAVRGKPYAPDEELGEWLAEYAKSTDIAAKWAAELGISAPVKTRAIAPTGTIGILAGTTSGIEPVFATAIKRRYYKDGEWYYQYVLDATAQRIIDRGVDPATLETAYNMDPEQRVRFQHWVQQYVDHGISSTINLPDRSRQPFSVDDFGEMLMRYLPGLRGITVYPDGSRGGQPLNAVPYDVAKDWIGYEYQEFGAEHACVGGVCGI